jgi:hypothetical protein
VKAPTLLRGIRARLAAIIILAMTALVVLLVYQQIQERNEDRRQGEENLQRLAVFAAHAQRERFESAERLLALVAQSSTQMRALAAAPDSVEAFDACTRTLFVLDALLPGTTGFALWDTSGRSLCSSEGAVPGEYNVVDHFWFRTARDKQGFATGEYELSPPDDEPSVGFGVPIRDAAGGDRRVPVDGVKSRRNRRDSAGPRPTRHGPSGHRRSKRDDHQLDARVDGRGALTLYGNVWRPVIVPQQCPRRRTR